MKYQPKKKNITKKLSTHKKPKSAPLVIQGSTESIPDLIYQELKAIYLEKGISQLSTLICRKIANNPCIPSVFSTQNLLSKILNIVSSLLMNELEITLLSIYLEKYGWRETDLSLDYILLFSALLAKQKLNENIEVFMDYCASAFLNFSSLCKKWDSKYSKLPAVTLIELNEKFMKLTSNDSNYNEYKTMNYNNCVDEILRTSVSYNVSAQKKKKKRGRKQSARNIMSNIDSVNKLTNGVVSNKPLQNAFFMNNSIQENNIQMFQTENYYNFPGSLVMDRFDSICTDLMSFGSRRSSNHDAFRTRPTIDSPIKQ